MNLERALNNLFLLWSLRNELGKEAFEEAKQDFLQELDAHIDERIAAKVREIAARSPNP